MSYAEPADLIGWLFVTAMDMYYVSTLKIVCLALDRNGHIKCMHLARGKTIPTAERRRAMGDLYVPRTTKVYAQLT